MKIRQASQDATMNATLLPYGALSGYAPQGSLMVEVVDKLWMAVDMLEDDDGGELPASLVFDTMVSMADGYADDFSAPMAFRALRRVLLAEPGISDDGVTLRAGLFSRAAMVAAEGDIDLVQFQLMDQAMHDLTFPNGRGSRARLESCYIPPNMYGQFACDPIRPTLMVWDKKEQKDLPTPTTWVLYAQAYLRLNQQGVVDAEHSRNKDIKHDVADRLRAIKLARK